MVVNIEKEKNPLLETLNTIHQSDKYNEWIYRKIRTELKGKVLDIGSGVGSIAQYFLKDSKENFFLSDTEPEMLSYLRKRFSSYQEQVVVTSLDVFNEEQLHLMQQEQIQTITCINVLEHIKEDQKALEGMHRILSNEGTLILMVPAMSSIYGTLDALVSHHRRYDKPYLNDILKQAHFDIQHQSYMNFFGIITWFIAGKVLKQKQFDPNACRKLNAIVPFLEWMENIFLPPVGQSLITICKKK